MWVNALAGEGGETNGPRPLVVLFKRLHFFHQGILAMKLLVYQLPEDNIVPYPVAEPTDVREGKGMTDVVMSKEKRRGVRWKRTMATAKEPFGNWDESG